MCIYIYNIYIFVITYIYLVIYIYIYNVYILYFVQRFHYTLKLLKNKKEDLKLNSIKTTYNKNCKYRLKVIKLPSVTSINIANT